MIQLRHALAAVPDVVLDHSPAVTRAIADSIAYLDSEAARASIAVDTYWPKWDSPWWHMVVLFELGLAHQIPERAVTAMVDGLNALPLHDFPLRASEVPTGIDPTRHASCHCAIGCIDQVLAARGVDVDRVLPWFLPWYPRYQMADGGLSCDSDAYLVTDEVPSSMVGTVAPVEAMLRRGPSAFLDRAAAFLVGRELCLGSTTKHNAEERDVAPSWIALTFPRFYFYDVLRGASALVRWATLTQQPVPVHAIATVAEHLLAEFPDGVVRLGRRAFAGRSTRRPDEHAVWSPGHPTSTFALLEATSQLGAPSPALTRQWAATRHSLIALLDAGRVVE